MPSKVLRRLIERDGPMLVIDLEATCSTDESVPKKEMEIIEIGAVALDESARVIDRFQAFVRPVRHPILTDFCRELTTITQSDVDAAHALPEVTAAFRDWVATTGADLWGSWGIFDRMLFERDFAYHGIASPLPPTHTNLRECFEEAVAARPQDFGTALGWAGLTFEGQQHRGIDDARNIARLIPYIVDRALGEGDGSRPGGTG